MCLPVFVSLGSHFLPLNTKLRSGSRFLCDPSRCHWHGESLVMPKFLFLVLLLPSDWNHWPVRDLSEEINMLISVRPSPSAAASVPLCISRYSFPWSIRQDSVPCAPQQDVIQTYLLWRAGTERKASTCTWVCVCREAAGHAVTSYPGSFAFRDFQRAFIPFPGLSITLLSPLFPWEESWKKQQDCFQ